MTQQQQAPDGTRPPRKRGVPRAISVVAVKQLSPRMRRITFGGADLASFTWTGPAAHIKMTFPEAGSGADTVPVPGPDDPRSPNTRTYTPRRFDPVTKQLEVDFALHGPGRPRAGPSRLGWVSKSCKWARRRAMRWIRKPPGT